MMDNMYFNNKEVMVKKNSVRRYTRMKNKDFCEKYDPRHLQSTLRN